MFKNVIVRKPGKSIVDGIGSECLGKPNYEKALKQHNFYVEALKKTGVEVTILESLEEYPDSCFVEDTAVLTKKCAIICNPGADSRNGEKIFMHETLKSFYENIEEVKAPGTIDGGDVMMVGDFFYIGLSNRTNKEGAIQFIEFLRKYGYSGTIVPLKEVLHLKTGLAYLENNNLLIAGEFIEDPRFKDFNKIIIPEDESYGANCIWMNGYVLVPQGYPKTKKAIEDLGYGVIEVDTSEYKKLDGGLSCLSLRF
ncbi:dimethylarginine dimethylaminohydrolase family protein [Inediibacterium massiliense]|uniref:dimethylarginine dimethylaminohydrolase family protein n=1 Tax=Inediibacterium massiliense TaxID=1658111 RepID=UPI0006B4063E|nr:arginine deiminase family protein [Inediibacterium massiliense]